MFLRDRASIIEHFKSIVGEPIDANGNRRTLTLMVANEGVLDLLINLLCSARAANVDVNNFVVFSGQPEYCKMIESLGVKAIYHASLGDMPKEAAESYADRVFTKLMWLKVTSVYTALHAGFHVLFQDVDLVWIKDPVPYLLQHDRYDVIFMDDGARTPRFAPYFTNTGFYFVRHTPKTLHLLHRLSLAVGEIDFTASHQATLIRHLTEIQGAFGLQILVLDDREFPSGRMYHEQQRYVEDVKNHKVVPFVWHMCWTANRGQKVGRTSAFQTFIHSLCVPGYLLQESWAMVFTNVGARVKHVRICTTAAGILARSQEQHIRSLLYNRRLLEITGSQFILFF